ncbi:hypothetical protein ABH963_005687 [Bacillus sp. RC55]|uniref:RICIN domain-containing protein n=1 Tax=Bacillus sp. RC55 TaxID=3156292 RepID=UPI0038354F70
MYPDHQQWIIYLVNNGNIILYCKNSGLNLDNQGQTKDGTPVTTYHWTGTDHQLWKIEEYSDVDMPSITTSTLEPAPEFTNANTLPPTAKPVVTNYALIPCVMVTDPFGWNYQTKMQKNPYYAFTKAESWELQAALYNVSSGDERDYEITEVISQEDQQSMSKTTSITIGADYGFSFGPLSTSISASFTEELQVSESHSNTESVEVTKTLKHNNATDSSESWALYYREFSYNLQRLDGSSTTDAWTVLDSTKTSETSWPQA